MIPDDSNRYHKSIDKLPKNPEAFISPHKAMIYYVVGNRGSGKSSVDEKIGEINYRAGHVVIDLHGAANYESLYWIINHNCREYWQKQKLLKPNEKIGLHCNCFTRYQILLVTPEYVQIDSNAISEFNGKYYTKQEWIKFGNIEWNRRLRPINPNYNEWLRVEKLVVPNKGFKNRDKFINQLTNIILTARKENRIVVFNPIFFKQINHKMITLEYVIKEIPEIIRANLKPLTSKKVAELRGVDKPIPYDQWTEQEKNYPRVTLVFREFGSLVASNLTEEKEQIRVKKAIFWLVKVIRHYRMSLVADFQRFGDVYTGVRAQRDVIIFKQSNIDIFPEEYTWLKKDIQKRHDEIKFKLGEGYANLFSPLIEDLRKDQMYVVYPSKTVTGKVYKLFKITSPSFHHHSEDDEWEDETIIIKETQARMGTWRFITEGSFEQTDEGVLKAQDNNKLRQSDLELYKRIKELIAPLEPTKKKISSKEALEYLKQNNFCPEKWETVNALRTFVSRMKKKLADLGM